MKSSLMFVASLLASTSLAQESNGYTDAQARISLQLSESAYCGKDVYLT